MEHLYFAYGSNLDPRRMLERCPGATGRRAATLPDHALVFDKVALENEGTAYANVEPASGSRVEGALYALTSADLRALDQVEGHPYHYSRRLLRVLEADGTPEPAWVYLAVPDRRRHGLVPRPDHVAHMLAGADVLSESYVAALRQSQAEGLAAWDTAEQV